jgi:hypothetical protein
MDRGDEWLTDDEFAAMINGGTGFQQSVTLVVVVNSCGGGGFTGGASDLAESDHVDVIGPSGECPIDPPVLSPLALITPLTIFLGGTIETFFEAVADGAGEKEADADKDGCVTAAELEQWLQKEGWQIGPPASGRQNSRTLVGTTQHVLLNGKSLCVHLETETCRLPDIRPRRFRLKAEEEVVVSANRFGSRERLTLALFNRRGRRTVLGRARTEGDGHARFASPYPS